MKSKKVIILAGGPSWEHQVSIATAVQILKNINQKKYTALPVVVAKSKKWISFQDSIKLLNNSSYQPKNFHNPALILEREKPDVVFIAMHGEYGEDGTIQGMLEALGIRYTGSGILASALGMHKPKSCAIFKQIGLNIPQFITLNKKEYSSDASLETIWKKIAKPCVLKPADRGSSVGVFIIESKKELLAQIKKVFRYTKEIMIQEFIKGRELTCGVLDDPKGNPQPLTPIEIVPRKGKFYDYKSKYEDEGSIHMCPPKNISKKLLTQIQEAALNAHKTIGCSGMSRSDFILAEDGKLYILEINTIPGMTPTSLLPDAAKKDGISFASLIDRIISTALRD